MIDANIGPAASAESDQDCQGTPIGARPGDGTRKDANIHAGHTSDKRRSNSGEFSGVCGPSVSNENFACELVDKLALWLVTAYSETMAGHAGLGVEEGRRPSMGSEKQLFTHM